MSDFKQFTLTPRYWQNRVSRRQAAIEAGEAIPTDLFEEPIVGRTKHRIVLELDIDMARLVVADATAAAAQADVDQEPGIYASAIEARNAMIQAWPEIEND